MSVQFIDFWPLWRNLEKYNFLSDHEFWDLGRSKCKREWCLRIILIALNDKLRICYRVLYDSVFSAKLKSRIKVKRRRKHPKWQCSFLSWGIILIKSTDEDPLEHEWKLSRYRIPTGMNTTTKKCSRTFLRIMSFNTRWLAWISPLLFASLKRKETYRSGLS